ncbi:MAG: protein-export chaperone SecB [Acetobacter sp.]|nr:protein-export chaperone SecB [Acetobacter sp.]
MSEEAPPSPVPTLPLAINWQYVRDLSFEVPAGAEIFMSLRNPPQVSINFDVQTNKLQNKQAEDNGQMTYEVVLSIKTEAKEVAEQEDKAEDKKLDRIVFIAELVYAAVVTLNNPPPEMLEPILLVEVPRLIFPYARNIISEITSNGGFPPIVIQPIDFVALWQSRVAQVPQPTVTDHIGHA